MNCIHEWVVIKRDEGIIGFLAKKKVVIYTLKCKKCGDLTSRQLPTPDEITNSEEFT